jgi:hypothetical protein
VAESLGHRTMFLLARLCRILFLVGFISSDFILITVSAKKSCSQKQLLRLGIFTHPVRLGPNYLEVNAKFS